MAFFMPPIFVFNLYSDYIRRKSARQESSTAVLRTMAVSSHGHFRLAVTKLAKLSNKDIQTVLDMKKINNRWGDVAEQLGVDRSALRPNMGKGQFRGHGPQGGPPDGGEMPDEK